MALDQRTWRHNCGCHLHRGGSAIIYASYVVRKNPYLVFVKYLLVEFPNEFIELLDLMECYLLIFSLKSFRWKHVMGMDKGTIYDLEKGSPGGKNQTILSQRSEHPKPLPPQSNKDVSSPPAYNEAIHI